jgi:hypothetical protein
MMTPSFKTRTSATAIAAVLALSSTVAVAQETVTPPATSPPPIVTPEATVPDAAPASPTLAPDPVATEVAVPATPTKRSAKPTRTAAARPKAAPPPPPAAHRSAPVAAAAAPAAIAPTTTPAKPAPGIDTTAATAPKPAPAPEAQPAVDTEQALMLGGGALALLALGGAGIAAMRRRRRREDELVDETQYVEEPVEPVAPQHDPIFAEQQPALVAPAASAFAWGSPQPTTAGAEDDGSDRRAGETWVERAYRGPSPANPSVSLRARLKRAAFFDKRERDVAAGTAAPVDPDAGLPAALVEEQEAERALA